MLLVLLLITASAPPVVRLDAASTWARTYRGSEDSIRKDVMRMPDGDIVVTATLGASLRVTRLSPEGDVRWSSTYDIRTATSLWSSLDSDLVGAIACTPSGMLVFGRGGIIRLNDSGTVRWARRYAVDEVAELRPVSDFTDAAELPDRGYVVCGATLGGVFVSRLSGDGSVVWANVYALEQHVGRPRVFALPGGGVLLGATGLPVENRGFDRVELLWLTADGSVKRSLAYDCVKIWTPPVSSFSEGMVSMTMTSTGPVFCQKRYSNIKIEGDPVGCTGTSVVKLDMAGAVQWTTWVGGSDLGPRMPELGAIDEAPDGSLLLAGRADYFDEHDVMDWGPYGLAMKLTPQGDLAWLSTVHDEVMVDSRDSITDSGDIAATDDGGLVWAGSSNREEGRQDALVIRMAPDGTAGKLGVYLTQVDIGNPRIVRIEHPAVTATVSTRTSKSVTCESEVVQVQPSDADLTGTEVDGMKFAKLTLVPLYPADPATPSSIMQGGTMYRYYTVLNAEGETVKGLELRYRGPFSTATLTATSDEHGEIVFSFAVPRNGEPKHWDTTLTIDRVRVNGLRSTLASRPDFATDVLPLSWSTSWMMGAGVAGKAGLGIGAGLFGAAGQAGGMVLTRTEADPAWDGKGSMLITDSMTTEAAIGVQTTPGEGRFGTVEVKGPEASARVTLGTFIDFASLFNKPSECSTAQKLMAALALLLGVSQVATAGATTVMGVAQSAIAAALSSDIEMEHLTGGLSLGVSGDAAAVSLALVKRGKTPAGATTAKSIGGVTIGKAGAGEKILLSITGYPGAEELSGKAAAETSVSFSVLEALGYSVVGWSNANSISAEVVVDPLNASFERFVTTMSVPPDDRGEAQETRLTVDNSVLGVVGAATGAVISQLMALAPTDPPTTDTRIVLSKEFAGELLRSVVNAVASVAIPYEHVVTQDKTPTSIEVGLGVSVLGTGVDLAVKPTWGRYQSYPLERGVFVPMDKNLRLGRMVKLESYPAGLFSTQVDTLGSVIVELLKVVGELLSTVWDVATGWLSSAADTLFSVGSGLGSAIGSGATTVFEKGTSIILSPFTVKPGAFPVFVAASLTKKVTMIGTPPTEGSFAIGGTYILEPENGTLSKPASLTISCSAAELGTRKPASLSIYRYDPVARLWSPLATKYDSTKKTFSAQITQMGGYCVGTDTTPPVLELLLPAGTPAVATSPTPQLTVSCKDAGSGVAPESLVFWLNGQPLTATWSPSAQTATMFVTEPLSEGEHALQVRAVDGNGNVVTTPLPFQVRQAPAPPVLRLDSVSTAEVQLGLESGTGGGRPTSFVLWRSEPAVGPIYHRLSTVKSGAGTYVDKDVRSGATYLYAASGLTSADAEGPMSEPLSVTLPSAPGSGDQNGTEGFHGSSLLWLLAMSFAALLALVFIIDALVTRRRRRPPTG